MSEHQRETLRFNPNNATTGAVERVMAADGSTRILKQLRRAGTVTDAPAHWRASRSRTDWNYWAREIEAYTDPRLRESLIGTGLDLPAAEIEEHENTVDLWLEDIQGIPGAEFSVADHAALASGLGHWHARPAQPQPRWASHGFLRAYATSRPADYSLLDDDAAWAQPLIRDNWPPQIRDGWTRLVARQNALFDVMEHLPRTLSHLDSWVANVIRRPRGDLVLLDWAFAGDGAVGEDLGNYIPDAVFDLFWPAERMAELEHACWNAYVTALRDGGWGGSERDARLGVVASCVKYIWLVPLLLTAACEKQHFAYHAPADSNHLYQQRGAALAHLIEWSEEAYALSE